MDEEVVYLYPLTHRSGTLKTMRKAVLTPSGVFLASATVYIFLLTMSCTTNMKFCPFLFGVLVINTISAAQRRFGAVDVTLPTKR